MTSRHRRRKAGEGKGERKSREDTQVGYAKEGKCAGARGISRHVASSRSGRLILMAGARFPVPAKRPLILTYGSLFLFPRVIPPFSSVVLRAARVSALQPIPILLADSTTGSFCNLLLLLLLLPRLPLFLTRPFHPFASFSFCYDPNRHSRPAFFRRSPARVR